VEPDRTIAGMTACPTHGLAPARKDGWDRAGRQVCERMRCGRRFTGLIASRRIFSPWPCGWYLRYRLSYGEVAPSTVYSWVQRFALLYQEAASSPVLPEVLTAAEHEAVKLVQQRAECDPSHLKGRLRPTRGFSTPAGVWVLCASHALARNRIGGFYRLGALVVAAPTSASARVSVV
jgi:hypothetical protein